jgi:hypothetical protein
MGTLAAAFEKKYGFDGVKFVKDAANEYYDIVKTLGIERVLQEYAQKKGYNDGKSGLMINAAFLQDLISVMAEAGERFPQNQKVSFDLVSEVKIPPQFPSSPKSKGVLEDFKNIVSDDDLRPQMTGVYVDPENLALVGTDAHKLVVYRDYENFPAKKYEGKIINLTKYLGTKGAKIEFIDQNYPKYEQVIPKDNPNKVKHCSTYAFYNLSMSAVAVKKLTTVNVFNIHFKYNDTIYGFNPIIFAEVTAFALMKGFDEFDLEFSTPNRAFVMTFFKGGHKTNSIGLIMPIMVYEGSYNGSEIFTFDEVQSKFGQGKAGKKTKTTGKRTPAPAPAPAPKRTETPYKRWEGSMSDVDYVPRRDIAAIILKDGTELSNAEIIDGVYRLKASRKAHGGNLHRKYAEGGTTGGYKHDVEIKTGSTIKGKPANWLFPTDANKKSTGVLFRKGGITKKEFAASKMEKVMGEFKRGKLRSGSGAKVTQRDQAIAIGLSEGREGWKKRR